MFTIKFQKRRKSISQFCKHCDRSYGQKMILRNVNWGTWQAGVHPVRKAYLSPRGPGPPAKGMAQALRVGLLALKQIFL